MFFSISCASSDMRERFFIFLSQACLNLEKDGIKLQVQTSFDFYLNLDHKGPFALYVCKGNKYWGRFMKFYQFIYVCYSIRQIYSFPWEIFSCWFVLLLICPLVYRLVSWLILFSLKDKNKTLPQWCGSTLCVQWLSWLSLIN